MAATAGLNTEELVQAQSRYSRLNVLFWGGLALIPLGVILPCLLSAVAYKIWGDTVSAPVALSALLWPIVGVAGALLVRGERGRARRSLALAKLADTWRLRFTRVPPPQKYEFLKSVSFMANPHAQSAQNLIEGMPSRWPLVALDYTYSYLWGAVTETGAQTIATFLTGFERLPEFGVVPISTMGKIENFFLGRGSAIPFPQEPQFARNFAVVGSDPAAVAGCMTRPLIDLLLADPRLTLIVEGGRLLVFRRLTFVAAEDYQAFLAQAHRAAELLTGGR